MNSTPADPRDEMDDDGAFAWLPRDEHTHDVDQTMGYDPVADVESSAHRDTEPVSHEPVAVRAHVESRLDPLTISTVINRALVVALCLVAVALTVEVVRAMSSSAPSASTTVRPTPQHTRVTPSTARKEKAATHPGPTTTTTVRQPPTTPPQTAPRSTTPQTFPHVATAVVTAPRRTTPPTFRRVVPTQPVVVPVTTPPATAPRDTVAVPIG